MKPRVTDIAYAAGMFDGEGSVTISLQQGKYVRIELSVSQKIPNVLYWFKANFGGKVYQSKDYAAQWKLHGAKAVEFLEIVHPYLICKAKDAEEAVKIWSIRDDGDTADRLIRDRQASRGSGQPVRQVVVDDQPDNQLPVDADARTDRLRPGIQLDHDSQ